MTVRKDGSWWGHTRNKRTVGGYTLLGAGDAAVVHCTVSRGMLIRTMVETDVGTCSLLPKGDPVRGMDLIPYLPHDFDLVGSPSVDGAVAAKANTWRGRSRRRCRRSRRWWSRTRYWWRVTLTTGG